MSKSFVRSEAFKFASANTIDHFGLWLGVSLIELLVIGLRAAAWLSFFGMSLLLYLDVAPLSLFKNPQVGTIVMGMGAVRLVETIFMWLSLKTLGAALLTLFILDLIGGVILMGAVQMGFDLYAKKKTGFSQLFSHIRLAFSHFIASFLYKIIAL